MRIHGALTKVRGFRVGDFAVRQELVDGMGSCGPVFAGTWSVDHLPSRHTMRCRGDASLASFVADELAQHMDGVPDPNAVWDTFADWFEHVRDTGERIKYRHWIAQRQEETAEHG